MARKNRQAHVSYYMADILNYLERQDKLHKGQAVAYDKALNWFMQLQSRRVRWARTPVAYCVRVSNIKAQFRDVVKRLEDGAFVKVKRDGLLIISKPTIKHFTLG